MGSAHRVKGRRWEGVGAVGGPGGEGRAGICRLGGGAPNDVGVEQRDAAHLVSVRREGVAIFQLRPTVGWALGNTGDLKICLTSMGGLPGLSASMVALKSTRPGNDKSPVPLPPGQRPR